MLKMLLFTGGVVSLHNGASVSVTSFFFPQSISPTPHPTPPQPPHFVSCTDCTQKQEAKDTLGFWCGLWQEMAWWPYSCCNTRTCTHRHKHKHTQAVWQQLINLCLCVTECVLFFFQRTWIPSYPNIQVRHMQLVVRNGTTHPPPPPHPGPFVPAFMYSNYTGSIWGSLGFFPLPLQ